MIWKKNVNIEKTLYFRRFWLYSIKFNNLAKKIKSQQILKSHCEEETSIFKSIIDSITKKICQYLLQRVNEFFKFSRRMLFALPSKRILTTSDKSIQYYPCCDISQWTFNKKRKTIFILPWKATIYFFDSVCTESKGPLSSSPNESPSYIIILSRLPFRMNQLAKIQWHCPVIDDIVSSRWGAQPIQRGNSHAPWPRYHATTFYFELWSRSFPPRMSRYPLHFHSFLRLRSVEPRSVTGGENPPVSRCHSRLLYE